MVIDLNTQFIVFAAIVIGPKVLHRKADSVKWIDWATGVAYREVFRV
jgi:hypothetical protein